MRASIGRLAVIFLFAVLWHASSGQQVPALGRGVNVELWGPAQLGTPSERIDRAKAAGFDFVRLGVPITPWLLEGKEGQRPGVLHDASEALSRASADRLRVLVTLFVIDAPGGVKTGAVVCGANGERGRFLEGLDAILALLADFDSVALEPLNEPPGGCSPALTGTAAGKEWPALQWDLYQKVRKSRPHLTFVVDGGDWGQLDGLIAFDPKPYVRDIATVFSFHYYEPKLFTLQGVTFMTPEEQFAQLVPWPVDEERWAAARTASIKALDVAMPPAPQNERLKASLAARFDSYRAEGSVDYLTRRFQAAAGWAARYGIDPQRVLVDEVGVARATHNTRAEPQDDAGRYLRSVTATANSYHFPWAIWDLDGEFGILCGNPPNNEVCSSYQSVLAPGR
jgi:endoglucanase